MIPHALQSPGALARPAHEGRTDALLDSPLDRWVRRAAVATLLAVALALATTGLILYGAPAEAAVPAADLPTAR